MTTAAGVIASTTMAHAGGFAVREQSTSSQGASFAGSAAGGDLSSMFWNPAALGASEGTNTESHAAIFIGRVNLEADGGSLNAIAPLTGASPSSGDIAEDAVIPASYYGHQFNSDLWVGLSINSPFGLVTKPADRDFQGAVIARRSKIFTVNASPTVAYQVLPGVVVGAGLQVQYMDAELKFATSPAAGAPSAVYEGDDVAFGGTFGLYLTPFEGTQIGLGYRSEITHTLEGDLSIVGDPLVPFGLPASSANNVELTTPDILTFSIRQAVTSNLRVMGTFEWTNWSDFDAVSLTNLASIGQAPGSVATIEANWENAWFASLGAEYDWSDKLTVRGGLAYEESPIQEATQRLTPVPDADRFWVSVGATYKVTDHATLDFAYTHVFVDEARFERESAVDPTATITGTADSSVDIISFSLKQKLDADHPILGGLF